MTEQPYITDNELPRQLVCVAQGQISATLAASSIEQAANANEPGQTMTRIAALATAARHLSILENDIQNVMRSLPASAADPEPQQNRLEALADLLRQQRQLTIALEDEQQIAFQEVTPGTAGVWVEPDEAHMALVTAINIVQVARRCHELLKQADPPHASPLCFAWLCLLDILQTAHAANKDEDRLIVGAPDARALADDEAQALVKDAWLLYSEGMPVDISPAMTQLPETARRWVNRPPHPRLDEHQTLWRGHPDAVDFDDSDRVIIVVSMMHGGRRHIGTLEEALPVGTSRQRILRLLERIEAELRLDRANPDSKTPTAVHQEAGMMLRRCRKRAELDLHVVQPHMVAQLIKAARAQGRTTGQITALLQRLTEGNQELAEQLSKGTNSQTAVGNPAQAARILDTARLAGLDEHQVRLLCNLMGHPADLIKMAAEPADLKQLQRLMNEAMELGFPQEATLRIMESQLYENQPFFNCRLDDCGFTLSQDSTVE